MIDLQPARDAVPIEEGNDKRWCVEPESKGEWRKEVRLVEWEAPDFEEIETEAEVTAYVDQG